MNTKHKTLFLVLILAFWLVSLPNLRPAPVMNFRTEGASRVDGTARRAAFETARANALKKAFESQLNTLALLTEGERGEILQRVSAEPGRFVVDAETVMEEIRGGMARVIVAGQMRSESLLNALIEAGFLERLKQKPRVVLAIDERHKEQVNPKRPFSNRLTGELAALRLPVLPADLSGGDDAARVKQAYEAGADLVIVGESTTLMRQNRRLPAEWLTCRALVSLRALRTDTGEALSTMEWSEGGLGRSEAEAIKQVFSRLPAETVKDFARDFLTKWHVSVTRQEIVSNPMTVGTPPQIEIDAPQAGEAVETEAVRLQGRVFDDRSIESVQLFVNGTQIPLTDAHLLTRRRLKIQPYGGGTTDSVPNRFSFSRLIPVQEGENIVHVVAHDSDNNRAEATVRVVRLTPITSTPPHTPEVVDEISLTIQTPQDGETVTDERLTLKGQIRSTRSPVAKIQIFVNGVEVHTPVKVLAVEPLGAIGTNPAGVSFQRTMLLYPDENLIEVRVMTEQGAVARQELIVVRQTEPSVDEPGGGQKYAVLIGIADYRDPLIPQLSFTRADAEGMRAFLVEQAGFPEANVKLLLDEQATLTNLQTTIGQWLAQRVTPQDTVILFYSGHGGLEADRSGESPDGQNRFLLNYDADSDNLHDTALHNPKLAMMLGELKSKHLLFFLDCCYSGGIASGEGVIKFFSKSPAVVTDDVYDPFAAGHGRIVISASRADQISWEFPDLRHGVFTYHLLGGLNGNADLNGDGNIQLLELQLYLVREVVKTSEARGTDQTPTLMGRLVGDFVISRGR